MLTHALGALASVAGGAVLIVFTALRGDAWRIVGASVFVASAIALYTASALYHAARRPEWRKRLRVADHAAIYLLIAGTYTPFTLVGLRGGWGWSIFGVIWGLAASASSSSSSWSDACLASPPRSTLPWAGWW